MRSEKDIRDRIEYHKKHLEFILNAKEDAILLNNQMKLYECAEKEFYHRTAIALFSWILEKKIPIPARQPGIVRVSWTDH